MIKQFSSLGLLFILLTALGFFFVVVPQINDYTANVLTDKATTARANSYDTRIKDLDSILASGTSFQNTIDKLQLALPKGSQVPETLVMVQSLGTSSGITFTGLNVGATSSTVNTGGLSEMPVTVSFTGSTSNLQSFLNALKSNIRTVNVDSQRVSVQPSGALNVTMSLGLVYQGGN